MATRCYVLFCLLAAWCPPTLPQTLPTGNRLNWNKSRGFAPFHYATPDAIVINDTLATPLNDSYSLSSQSSDFTLRFTAANLHNHPSKTYSYFSSNGSKRKVGYPAWGFFVKGNNGDSLIVKIQTKELADALSSEARVHVKIHNSSLPAESVETTIKEGIDCYIDFNNWQLTANDRMATLSCGNHSMAEVLKIRTPFEKITGFGFTAYPGACLDITGITFTDNSTFNLLPMTSWSNPNHLQNTKDPLEGYWTVFDRSLEESLLQLGGDYRFAIVKEADKYLIIYLDGARINAPKWQAGMVKGYLTPDLFPDIYNVTWIDSEGLPLNKDIKAQKGEGETLTIQFPYQSSSLRLRKIAF